jgi:hypothetical protein
MTEKLNELMRICGINHLVFVYQKEGNKNFIEKIDEPEKTIIVNIVDTEDNELGPLLDSKIKELKELFQ